MYLYHNSNGHPLVGGKRLSKKFQLMPSWPKLVAINGDQVTAYREAMA